MLLDDLELGDHDVCVSIPFFQWGCIHECLLKVPGFNEEGTVIFEYDGLLAALHFAHRKQCVQYRGYDDGSRGKGSKCRSEREGAGLCNECAHIPGG